MFVKKFKLFFFYSLSTLFLCLLTLYVLNPKLYSYGIDQSKKLIIYRPNFFLINPESNLGHSHKSSPVQYRNDENRSGFYKINFNPLDVKISYLNETPVNHGGHKASKSTPISNDEYIISASDKGIVQIFKNLKIHWELRLYNSNLGFHGTPIIFGHYAILGEYSGRLYFLNLQTKKIIWMGQFGNSFGATPWLEDHFLYYNVETSHPNGYLGKIDLLKTKLVWTSMPLGNHSHSSPAVDKHNLYLGDNNSKFQAISKSTGKTEWAIRLGGPVKSTPALDKDRIYISSWDGYLYCLNSKNGEFFWKYKLSKSNQSSVALDSEKNIGFINDLTGIHKFDLKSGKQLSFIPMKMGPESKKASPVILKYKNKTYLATACYLQDICILATENLSLLKKISFKEGLSSQLGVNPEYLIVSLNKNQPLMLLKP